MGTILVAAVLAGIVVLIIRQMYKDKKKGINPSCGCKCSDCHGMCHSEKKG